MTEPKPDTQDELKIQQQLKTQIEQGLRELRKQCKQLSKNELITALLQQIETGEQMRAVAQQLHEENKKLKEAAGQKDSNEITSA